ncbi:MAG: YIP1 family protein [Pseudomonadota bacterium]|nr:YIP1 family protein [Pseudomonadota bacterium]
MYTRHKKHFFGLFSVPRVEWKSISDEKTDLTQFGLTRLIFFAAVPAISFLIGLTQVGWSLSGTDYNKVAMGYAFLMAVAFYVLIVVATLLMAYFTFAMERAFGTEASFERCFIFVTYTATPMYMAGLVGFLPIVWLCMMVLMAAVFYSLYLLYIGIPIYMNIPEGKGFIVATSIVSAGLCMMVCFNVATVIIWSIVV